MNGTEPKDATGGQSEGSLSFALELTRFLQRMLGTTDAVDDIVRASYAEVRAAGPQAGHADRALLFDIATGRALAHLRGLRTQPTASADSSTTSVTSVATVYGDRNKVDEAMKRLPNIIAALQPDLRQVFLMRYVSQMPRQEIAARLRISPNTVEHRLTRALTLCREQLTAAGLDWVTSSGKDP